ncbi:putative Long chain fatty acid CoA ligase [Giardia muris]|uniref:Putative Long chain fatty acid CoA ligase n=1 Tax=Giardia muris TaxID=5742 RepID=A0A4Z1SVA6_GIAMU|nr:putative Long chain fatty acid CoA ligase [Giardia muris]|eukprot:TNJ28855.1 putative Long chain fatty acid CoA ligase [Giardia muris]
MSSMTPRSMVDLQACPLGTPSHIPLQEECEPDQSKTTLQNARRAFQRYGDLPFIGHRAGLCTSSKEVKESYSFITFSEADAYITRIAKALLKIGVQPGDRIGLYARNSPLWLLTDYACTAVGAVLVPLYDTLGAVKLAYCLNHAEVSYVITQAELAPLIFGIWPACVTTKHIVILDQWAGSLTDLNVSHILRKAVVPHIELENLTDEMLGINLDGVLQRHRNVIHVALTDVSLETASDTTDVNLTKANIGAENQAILAIMDAIAEALDLKTEEEIWSSSKIHLLTQLLKDVDDIPYEGDYPMKLDDVHSIIYTSGTSGNPKGVVHTAATIQGSFCMGRAFLPYRKSDITGETSMIMSYLPLGHIYERATEHYCTVRGVQIAYYSGNVRNLVRDIQLSRPTILPAVPRVLQKIYNAVMAKLDASVVKRLLFSLACKVKEAFETTWIKTGYFALTDAFIFKDIRKSLGGRVELILCGSSALPLEVWRFMRLCTGARVACGYGSTETCIAGLRVLPHEPINLIPTGRLVSDMDGRLIDRSDACEYTLSEHKVGELLLRGPGVALEYYKLPDTPLRDEDGFYHTGDLMRLNDDGSLTFIRRVSMVVKTLMGEYLDIYAIEEAMERSPLITGAYIHAEANRSFPICICTLDKAVLCHRLHLSDTTDNLDAILTRPEIVSQIQKLLIEEANITIKRAGLKGFCVPKCCRWFFDIDWTQDTTLMTPSMKKQHRFFRERYAKEIAEMWDELDEFDRKHSK